MKKKIVGKIESEIRDSKALLVYVGYHRWKKKFQIRRQID